MCTGISYSQPLVTEFLGNCAILPKARNIYVCDFHWICSTTCEFSVQKCVELNGTLCILVVAVHHRLGIARAGPIYFLPLSACFEDRYILHSLRRDLIRSQSKEVWKHCTSVEPMGRCSQVSIFCWMWSVLFKHLIIIWNGMKCQCFE